MAFSGTPKRLAGATFVASAILMAAPPAPADEAAARAAIEKNCERCHPPLPGGGWEVMTEAPHDRAEMTALLRRMAEEYSAFPSPQERQAIIALLSAGE